MTTRGRHQPVTTSRPCGNGSRAYWTRRARMASATHATKAPACSPYPWGSPRKPGHVGVHRAPGRRGPGQSPPIAVAHPTSRSRQRPMTTPPTTATAGTKTTASRTLASPVSRIAKRRAPTTAPDDQAHDEEQHARGEQSGRARASEAACGGDQEPRCPYPAPKASASSHAAPAPALTSTRRMDQIPATANTSPTRTITHPLTVRSAPPERLPGVTRSGRQDRPRPWECRRGPAQRFRWSGPLSRLYPRPDSNRRYRLERAAC